MDVRIGWAEFDATAAPFEVRVGWAEFDATASAIDVRVGWAVFDAAAPVDATAPAVRTTYSTQAIRKKRRRPDEATEIYVIPVDMTDEDDEEAVILAILLEVCRYEFF